MPAADSSSRDQILDAAEELFAKKGFDASTIKQIGARARLNPALIYYYFGGKDDLYHAVLERLVGGLVARGRAALDRPASPPEAIRALVRAQLEFVLASPSLPKIMVREMVDHDARHAKGIILETVAGLFDRLCGVIEAGQREGVFRSDVEPRFAAVSTISQVAYFILARPAITLFFGERGSIPAETFTDFGRHAGDFAVHALSQVEALP